MFNNSQRNNNYNDDRSQQQRIVYQESNWRPFIEAGLLVAAAVFILTLAGLMPDFFGLCEKVQCVVH